MSNPVVILKNTTGANLKYKGIVIKYTLDRDHFRQVDPIETEQYKIEIYDEYQFYSRLNFDL